MSETCDISWIAVQQLLYTGSASPFSPRNTLRQSANSRSRCSRTIMWHTPPWSTGSSSRAGAGTSVWTRKEKSWRGTMSRKTSQQPTSFPNLWRVSLYSLFFTLVHEEKKKLKREFHILAHVSALSSWPIKVLRGCDSSLCGKIVAGLCCWIYPTIQKPDMQEYWQPEKSAIQGIRDQVAAAT